LLNSDNSGDASFEVAQYLNGLLDAKNLYVWTDVRQVCEKFVGKCAFGLKGWSSSNDTFDYFVVPVVEQSSESHYVDNFGKIKIGSSLLNATDLYDINKSYDFKVSIDGRDITTIKVIKNKQ